MISRKMDCVIIQDWDLIIFVTMEKVLADINKVIIDKKAGGVVPYLPLPELSKKATN